MSDESPSMHPDQPGAGNAPESGARSARRPPADFTTLLLSVHESALQSMGVKGEEFDKDLEAAQYQIELLALLQEKTRGNLTDDEDRLLRTILYELRTTYLRVVGS